MVITSKCKSIKEAFYYIARIIDEGLSKRELEDIIDSDDFNKYGHAINYFVNQKITLPLVSFSVSQRTKRKLNGPWTVYRILWVRLLMKELK